MIERTEYRAVHLVLLNLAVYIDLSTGFLSEVNMTGVHLMSSNSVSQEV